MPFLESNKTMKIRKSIFAGVVGLVLTAFSSKSNGGEFNIQPAFNAKQTSATLRLEGWSKLNRSLDIYGFSDLDGKKEEPLNLENFYLEARLRQSLGFLSPKLEKLHLIPEFSVSNYLETRLKLGVGYGTSLWKGNYTTFRLFPYETSGKYGVHTTFYTEQEFAKRKAKASIVADINWGSRDIYLEPEISFKARRNLSFFLQGRSFGSLDNLGGNLKNIQPILGIKYHFSGK